MKGALVLMPNALDLGTGDAVDLQAVLPDGVIRRAAQIGYWVAENAKSARAFLKRVDAIAPLAQPLQAIRIEELPRPRKGAGVGVVAPPDLARLLAPALQGHDLALISEAGLPAVADPGSELVAAAHAQGLRVEPLAGPSSLALALAASGLHGQSFAFAGYLPVDAAARAARIRELEAASRRLRQTQIAIETPYRNAALLGALIETLQPATRLAVACGLTLREGWCKSAPVAEWRRAAPAIADHLPAVFLFLAT